MRLIGYEELTVLLGVSHPLLMLDRVSVDEAFSVSRGMKAVSHDDAAFLGHFPGRPVLPGVLQLSAMAQASEVLYALSSGSSGVVRSVRRVKFRKPVVPGMVLRVECLRGGVSVEGGIEYVSKVYSGEELVSCGTVCVGACPDGYYDVFEASEGAFVEESLPLEAGVIYGAVPHRYPFLFLDGVISLDLSGQLRGIKNVTGCGMYVNASSPAHFPGILQIESMAQLGCAAVLSRAEFEGCYGYFMSIDSARFYGVGLPGDRLSVGLRCEMSGHGGYGSGTVCCGGRLLTEACIKFAIVSAESSSSETGGVGVEKRINEAFYIQKS